MGDLVAHVTTSSRSEGATLLAATGHSQATIAARLGVSQPAVNKWLRGQSKPSAPLRVRILEAYNVPADAWDRAAKATSPDEPALRLKFTWTVQEIAAVLEWDPRSALAWLEEKGVAVHTRGGERGIRFVFLSDLAKALPAFGETLEIVRAGGRPFEPDDDEGDPELPELATAQDADRVAPRPREGGVWRASPIGGGRDGGRL